MLEFERIYQEYHPKIQRYLNNLAGEEHARDLTQTVFLNISRSLADFRGDSSLSTWIYRIATNLAHDHAASSLVRQQDNELLFPEGESLDDLPDARFMSADREYIRREMNACIRGVVNDLPENYRAVLILSEFDELSNSEIAEIVGISIDTVKIRLHRARRALRQAMECRCTFYHDERSEIMCDRK